MDYGLKKYDVGGFCRLTAKAKTFPHFLCGFHFTANVQTDALHSQKVLVCLVH